MASCTCVPPPCGPGWVGAPVGPNASVDRPRPSRAIGGEQRLGCDTGWKGLPEGGVRGRTLRLGKDDPGFITKIRGATELDERGGNWTQPLLRIPLAELLRTACKGTPHCGATQV